ncbi:hypothetical protein [Flavivirga sp. 57AJ16]|uniref:hypothetical protein n=1 Tax=Flavivirga sp. 57AJ16 TaxID=3025307 RepID=UPI0023652DF8|nr:hypothetical protein [Flavivirga sp. 57AJ16]MDD7887869.1 hypothetical protein [Flavivirga sp. 57AJ16]
MKQYTYYADDWAKHVMGPSIGMNAFIEFESKEIEISVVRNALKFLESNKVISNSTYSLDNYDNFVEAVKEHFHIPWTGISPRMRRLIYSINSINQPNAIVCAGIFCGYTYICNVGASIGSGASYNSRIHLGIELLEKEANLAKKNVENFVPNHGKNIICDDAVNWFNNFCNEKIDLLYIDAKSIEFDPKNQMLNGSVTESLYLKILKSAIPHLAPNALVLAHNSQNAQPTVSDYLNFVRTSDKFQTSINLVIDDAGLEVSKLY